MTPRVDFHVLKKNQEGAYYYLARLIEKAYHLNSTILLLCVDLFEAQRLDDLLWTFQSSSFVPHEIYNQEDAPGAPIVIAYKNSYCNADVLINLTPAVPSFFSHFSRVIELVYENEEVASLGRNKYRLYQSSGCQLETFKIH